MSFGGHPLTISPVNSDMMRYSLLSMLTAAHISMYVVKARGSILPSGFGFDDIICYHVIVRYNV